jgi:uncharacterized protein (TIGR02145 family)
VARVFFCPPPPPNRRNGVILQRFTRFFFNFFITQFYKKSIYFYINTARRAHFGYAHFGYAQCALFAPAKTPSARICQNYPVPPYSKDFQMKRLAIFFVALFGAAGAFAQSDTAYVPFVVNVDATVRAVPASGTTAVVTQVQMSVAANTQTTLKIPLPKTLGVMSWAQRLASVPAVISNGGGKVTLNLPAQSYKSAEIALYSVNGKRVLRKNVPASSAANAISRKNAAPGAYLLSVTGADGGGFTSRLTHGGGNLDITVAFGGENLSSAMKLAKEAAAGDWTVTVSATGRVDSVYAINPVAGTMAAQNIMLRETAPVTPGLGTPANVTATAASATSIAVSWSAVSGTTGYYVYRSASATGTYTKVGDVTSESASYTNTGLTTGTTYYYKVSAYNGSSESAQSSYVSAATPSVVLNPPTSITARETSLSAITVSWSAVSGAIGYRVYRGTNVDGGYEHVGTTTSTTYTNTGLPINVTYYYWVSVNSNAGEGPVSSSYASAAIDVISGTFVDYRDDKTYKYITVLGKKWMAENLNFEAASSYSISSYTWTDANTACPSGWHLPTRQEWGDLAIAAGGTGSYGTDGIAGKKLKSAKGWKSAEGYWDGKIGTDDFGFSALPGGVSCPGGRCNTSGFDHSGDYGYWWTATESDTTNAYSRRMSDHHDNVYEGSDFKSIGFSVRCLKD